MKKKNQYLGIVAFFVCALVLIFNDLGFIKLYSLNKERKLIQHQINNLIIKENNIIDEVERLQYDDEYIATMARELFYMAKKGEKIYRVEQEKHIE